MKSERKSSCSVTLTLLLVASSSLVNARPHAHGVFENIRRLIHPSKTNLSNIHAATAASSESGMSRRNLPLSSLRALLTRLNSPSPSPRTRTRQSNRRSGSCRPPRPGKLHVIRAFPLCKSSSRPEASGGDLARRTSRAPPRSTSYKPTSWTAPQACRQSLDARIDSSATR